MVAAALRHFDVMGPEVSLLINYSLAFIASLTLGSAILHVIKLVLGRRRPRDDMEMGLYGFMPLAFNSDYNSFPSGHALTICCVAVIFTCVWPIWWPAWFAIAAVLAVTRALLTAQFPQRCPDRGRHRADRGARSAAAGLSRFLAGLVLAAPRAEEIFQNRTGFQRMRFGLRHRWPVMAGGLFEEARAVQHRAALGIAGREYQPRHPRHRHGAGAHGAGLQADIERRADQPFIVQRQRARPHHQHLGMGGGVFQFQDAVAVPRQQGAIGGQQKLRPPALRRAPPPISLLPAPVLWLRRHSWVQELALAAPQKPVEGDRIAKVIARAGICSRRDAEKLILEGRVKVDGLVVTSPALNVTTNNVIQVDEKPLAERRGRGCGATTSPADWSPPQGRKRPRHGLCQPAQASGPGGVGGRLDFNTEGLLLLTNDGEISRRMEIPSAGWTRIYRVRLFGKVTQADLDKLAQGMTIDGVKYGPIVADLERSKGMHSWATVSLKEGKNREIKRVMERLGLKVSRLIRTAYGPFQLGQLQEGQVEEIPARLWREKLGIGRKKRTDRED